MKSDQLFALLDSIGDNGINLPRLQKQISTPLSVIPFVGAGLSIPIGFKSWSEFLLDQASKGGIGPETSRMLATGNYEQAGEAVLTNRGRRAFLNAIDDEYGDVRLQSRRLYGAADSLPRLTRGPVITTNFDHVLERAFQTADAAFERVVWGANATSVHAALTQDKHFLLKLHGDVEEQNDRILTHEDYDRYYAPGSDLCQVLRNLFIARPILFLGCSLVPDRWVQLLEDVARTNTAMEHFALVEYPATDDEYVRRQQFLSNHGISPIWFPHTRFDLIEAILTSLAPTPVPPMPLQRHNCLLTGASDTLLAHTTGFFGRTSEVGTILQFLHEAGTPRVAMVPSTPKILSVTGTPGIGKSEVCKEALGQFLREQPSARVYYVELVDVRDEMGLLACLASAFDVPEATPDEVYTMIAAQPCLLYLDNLEDMLRNPEARATLKELAALSGVSVLASSREHLAQLGSDLPILQLDPDAAIELFTNEWNKSEPHPPLTGSPELHEFVCTDLDRHALSIVLVAAQAYQTASLDELVKRWRDEETRLARLPYARDRLTSLDVSLERSLGSVQSESADAVTLWGLCALFPEGMSPAAFDAVTKAFADNRFQAREVLLRLNIIRFPQSDELGNEVVRPNANGITILMLAPLRRFILAKAQERAARLNIDRLLDTTLAYFSDLAMAAKQTEVGNDGTAHGRALDQLLPELPNLREAVVLAARRGTQWAKSLGVLSRVLSNSYQFRPLVSIDILRVLLPRQQRALCTADVAHTLLFLGGLEEYDAARRHYTQAIELYTKETDDLGLGNALASLGELEKYLGEMDSARHHYTQAIELCTQKQNNIGLSNALRGLGNLESLLGKMDQARHHYTQAIELYTKGHVDRGVADTLRSLGDLERELGEMDSARQHYTQAIELYTKERDNMGVANAVRGLGDVERVLGKMDSARQYYTRSMELSTKEHSNLGVANALRGLGDVELTLDQFQQADTHYAKARELYIAEREMMGLGYTCAELARIACALGQPVQADEYLDEGMQAAQASNVPSVMRCVTEAKTKIHPDATRHDGEPGA